MTAQPYSDYQSVLEDLRPKQLPQSTAHVPAESLYSGFLSIMEEPYDPTKDQPDSQEHWIGQPASAVMARKLKARALSGDLRAIQLAMEWMIGKAIQRTETVVVNTGEQEWRKILQDSGGEIRAAMAEARRIEQDRWTPKAIDVTAEIIDAG